MANKAVILDRDGTIIEDTAYLGDPAKVRLLPGAAAALAALKHLGYKIIIASNQSGVARGMFGEDAVELVNQELCRQLKEAANVTLDAAYYCPFHPEGSVPQYTMEHEWRKPQPGMIKQAAADFDLDLSQSWMIGDADRDIAAGAAAGCRTILLRDPERPTTMEGHATTVSPNFVVRGLADATRIIAREGKFHDLVNPQPAETVSDPTPASAASAAVVPPLATTQITIDTQPLEDAVARLGEHIANAPVRPDSLRPLVEEIAQHLRRNAREKEFKDFNMWKLLAIIGAAASAIAMIMAIWQGMAALDAPTASEPYRPLFALIRAGLWLLAAIGIQGLVLTTLMITRHK
ncbi:MAG: HAD family hydrolase [Phycisphaerae bacterium]